MEREAEGLSCDRDLFAELCFAVLGNHSLGLLAFRNIQEQTKLRTP